MLSLSTIAADGGRLYFQRVKSSGWYNFAAGFVRRIYLGVMGGYELRGVENVPQTSPLLVAPIHLSHIDPPLVGSLLPRQLRFMAKKELFFFPLGALISSLGAFPVSRGEGDSAAIRLTIAELQKGNAVLVFPEGTRGDGKTLGSIQTGIGMLAKRSGAQILPVGINGTQNMMPKGKSLPRRAKIIVAFGKPFTYEEVAVGENEKERRECFARHLRSEMIAACREAGLILTEADSKIAD